jgi:hypothetical protein
MLWRRYLQFKSMPVATQLKAQLCVVATDARVAPMNTVQACSPLVFHYFSSNASGVGGLCKTRTVTSSTVNQISTDLDVTKTPIWVQTPLTPQ